MDALNRVAPSTVNISAELDFIRNRMVEHPVFTAIRDIHSLSASLSATPSDDVGLSCQWLGERNWKPSLPLRAA